MSDDRFDNQNQQPQEEEGSQSPPEQDRYRVPGSSPNPPPPGGPPQGQPPPYRQPGGPYQPPPFGANNPYQQNNAQRESYRWNFEDYEATGRQKPPKRNRGLMVFGVLLAAVLAVGIVALSGYGVYTLLTQPPEDSTTAPVASDAPAEVPASSAPALTIQDRPSGSTGGESLPTGRMSTVDIAKAVRPSVVGVAQYNGYNTFEPTGEGSGIIMNTDGYILTNAHVVKGAMGISIELADGESYSAKLIGVDTKTDLAVVKIDAPNLVAAEFGNSDDLEVGETVVAIGNPGGSSVLPGSVTQGIVSGVNRSIQEEGYTASYIQVDAAINPGNSGGALVNQYGQVVGINSSKIADVDYEGIGFAIPVNDAKPIIDDLMNHGYVTGRVKLGITVQEVNEVTAQLNSIPVGLYVVNIATDSSLAGTSMTRGDVITHVNGERVETYDRFSEIIQSHAPGESLRLSVYRWTRSGGRGQTFEVDALLQEDIEQQQQTISMD